MPPLSKRVTVAAFSPGVSVGSKSLLKKSCTDGRSIEFYYRPVTYDEAKILIIKHEYFIDETITEEELNSCYCYTNGNPSCILSYLDECTYKLMFQEISKQFAQAQSRNIEGFDELCKVIIHVAVTQEGTILDVPGMCYCMDNSGLGIFKPSNILYLYHALKRLQGLSFGLEWRKLEVLTSVLVGSGAKLKVNGKDGHIDLPMSIMYLTVLLCGWMVT